MNTKNTKLLVVDMDGTLMDTTERYNVCQKLSQGNRKQFWGCFLSSEYMHLDKPNVNVIAYVKSLIDETTIIVVVSGRSKEKQYVKTIEQLKMIGINPHEIYLRETGDYRKDFEYKFAIIQQLIEKYSPDTTILVDDSDDVIKFIREKLPSVIVIDAKTIS